MYGVKIQRNSFTSWGRVWYIFRGPENALAKIFKMLLETRSESELSFWNVRRPESDWFRSTDSSKWKLNTATTVHWSMKLQHKRRIIWRSRKFKLQYKEGSNNIVKIVLSRRSRIWNRYWNFFHQYCSGIYKTLFNNLPEASASKVSTITKSSDNSEYHTGVKYSIIVPKTVRDHPSKKLHNPGTKSFLLTWNTLYRT